MANKSFLLLGEGDFTYSLDMCRYVSSLSATAAPNNAQNDDVTAPGNLPASTADAEDRQSSFSITCTGVDTLDELCGKYKDIEFVLRNIRSCQRGGDGNDGMHVDTTILHGINAVQWECSDVGDESDATPCNSFDHVLFNHPHLGTEDAQLHSRFLLHFFHAATKRWMAPRTGLLHLTLVNGQCPRWKCLEGAKRHGLVLLRRGAFLPPPATTKGGKTYYSLRRHQSGRSFANRRRMQQEQQDGESCQLSDAQSNDSETLVFGRACDYPASAVNHDVGLLPWEQLKSSFNEKEKTETAACSSVKPTNPFPCKYCSKSFQEHRSLKNHMVCSHPDCSEVRESNNKKKKHKRRKTKDREEEAVAVTDAGSDGVEGPPWICKNCEKPRVFPHKQALLDHQRAKHFGVHNDIKPDWYRGQDSAVDGKDDAGGEGNSMSAVAANVHGSCPICDHLYPTQTAKHRHEMEFLPSSSTVAKSMAQENDVAAAESANNSCAVYTCGNCSKMFRELRAQRQHENFCTLRGPTNPARVSSYGR